MKSFVKFLLFYAIVAISPSLYSMDYDFGGGSHHTVDFGRPAVTLSPHDSFDDLLARHMTGGEHSETHTPAPVRHTADEDDVWAGTSGSVSMYGSSSREGSPVATDEDPDENLSSLSDLTVEQQGDVMLKNFGGDEEGAKQLAKQYRQQNRAAQSTTVATDVDSLHMTDTVEVPIPAAEENRSLVPTAAVDSEALARAKQQGKQEVEDMFTVPEGEDPSRMMEFLGIDQASVMAPELKNASPAQQQEHLQKVKRVFDQAFDTKITELERSRDSFADELDRERFDGMVEALRAKKAEMEKELERYEEGDEEEVAPEQTDGTAVPTVAAIPETTTAEVTPMTRQEALSTLRLKDRRMPDGRIILSKPEIEAAYNKELAQARDLARKGTGNEKALKRTEDEYDRARKVLLDEVDSRIDDHNQQVREQVAVVRDVLGAKFKDNPNIKARDRQVIEQGFTKVATEVAEQVVKRGQTFDPANPEHAARLEQSMMQEINRNTQFKAALADPDVDSALEQASKSTGGSRASRSVAREARSSYSRQKMYDDVDSTLKKVGIGAGVGLSVVVIISAIVYELIQHNVIPL